MADDFYPFVDSGDPAPDNSHINGVRENPSPGAAVTARAEAASANRQNADAAPTLVQGGRASEDVRRTSIDAAPEGAGEVASYATRISIYDDLFSTPRVIVIDAGPVRPYLEEVTNTVYRCMKEQGGGISLMVIREIVENFIHAHFVEPIISILDGGNTIRFADQGPGIEDKERAFEFGVTSADRSMKRYIRGTGAGFPMVQQYLEAAGGAVSIEDNLGQGTVITVSVDPDRVEHIKQSSTRGAAVRSSAFDTSDRRTQTVGWNTTSPQGTMPDTGFSGSNRSVGGWGVQPGSYPPPHQATGAFPGVVYPAATHPGADYQTVPHGYPAAGYPTFPAYPAPYAYGWPGAGAMPGASNEPGGAATPWAPDGTGYQGYPSSGDHAAGGRPPYAGTGGGWEPAAQDGGGEGDVPPFTDQNTLLPSYQQAAPRFSTTAQQMPPAGSPIQGTPPAGAGEPAVTGAPLVTERGCLALHFLLEQGHAGPTELAAAYGQSGPTWSRELATLSKRGFVIKQGQKYYLTELGASWVRAHS